MYMYMCNRTFTSTTHPPIPTVSISVLPQRPTRVPHVDDIDAEAGVAARLECVPGAVSVAPAARRGRAADPAVLRADCAERTGRAVRAVGAGGVEEGEGAGQVGVCG